MSNIPVASMAVLQYSLETDATVAETDATVAETDATVASLLPGLIPI